MADGDGGGDEHKSLLHKNSPCKNCLPWFIYAGFFCVHVINYVLFALAAIYEKKRIWGNAAIPVLVLSLASLFLTGSVLCKAPCMAHLEAMVLPVLFSMLGIFFAGTMVEEMDGYDDLRDHQQARQASVLQATAGQASQMMLLICFASSMLLWWSRQATRDDDASYTGRWSWLAHLILFCNHVLAYLLFSLSAAYEKQSMWSKSVVVLISSCFALTLSILCIVDAVGGTCNIASFSSHRTFIETVLSSWLFLIMEIVFSSIMVYEREGYHKLRDDQKARQASILQATAQQASQMVLLACLVSGMFLWRALQKWRQAKAAAEAASSTGTN